tara:strand:+ start:26306 stop:28411 length:2106 start_codon:yes stop_codon:yes gene_type:complete
MTYLKKFTSLLLVLALFSLHIESGAIAFSSSFALENLDTQPIIENDEPTSPGWEGTNPPGTTTSQSQQSQQNSASIDMESGRQEAKLTMNQLMVLLILLTGPTVGIGCFSQISGKLFAASSAIYLLMEIMNYKKYKEAVTSTEKMYAELTENAEVNEEQIESFKTAEAMENLAADALKKRKDNTKILAIGVTAASIASFAESIWGTATYTSCTAVSLGAGACACEEADKLIQACMIAPCASIKLCLPWASGSACFVDSASPLKNKSLEYGPQLYATQASEQQDFALVEEFLKNNTQQDQGSDLQFRPFLEEVMNGFLSKAFAGDSPAAKGGPLSGMGITAAALGAVLTWYTSNKFMFLNKLGVGWIRGIYFGVLAGFAWLAVNELSKGEEKLRSNANIYKSLHERLSAAIESKQRLAGMGSVKGSVRDRLGGYQGIRDEMNNPASGAICLVGKLGEQRVDENCACRQTNSCSSVDLSNVDFGGLGLPGFFGQTTGGLQSGANSLFSGNLAGADSAFGSMGSNAANLRKLNDRVKAKAIADVNGINKNKKPIDLKAIEDKILEDVQKVAPSILQAAQAKNGSTLAALGIGTTGISSGLAEDPNKLTPETLLESISSKTAPAPAGKAKGMDFKFDFPEESNATTATGDVALSQGDALNEFESNESDISARPNENIFNIITVRYFKSAYPRIFNEQEKQRQILE